MPAEWALVCGDCARMVQTSACGKGISVQLPKDLLVSAKKVFSTKEGFDDVVASPFVVPVVPYPIRMFLRHMGEGARTHYLLMLDRIESL